MDYRDFESISTGIHTRITDTVRISSAWRTYANMNFESQAWETFLWDGDKIIGEYDTHKNANDVINLHLEIVNDQERGCIQMITMNIVSKCCQQPIVTTSKPEYPLGDKWSINYKVNICEKCGQEAEELEVCGGCGDVECLGGCLDD